MAQTIPGLLLLLVGIGSLVVAGVTAFGNAFGGATNPGEVRWGGFWIAVALMLACFIAGGWLLIADTAHALEVASGAAS